MELNPAQARQLSVVLNDALERFTGPLAGPCRRIVYSPGRRLRPALTIACAELMGPADPTAVVGMAAAVELMHCATLVHDDVIDGAHSRRGVDTINAFEGTATAIVSGDVLIAAALGLAGEFGNQAVGILTQTLSALCAGQAIEEQLRYDVSATPAQVLNAAELKTGSLLRAACLLGGLAAGLDDDLSQALGRYGAAVGVCLQMVDDVLDVVSTELLLGKPVASDVSHGVMSLPIVYCLLDHPELGALIGSPRDTPAAHQALDILRSSDALATTADAARARARAAAASLRSAAGRAVDVEALADYAPAFVEKQLRAKVHAGYLNLLAYPRPRLEVPSS